MEAASTAATPPPSPPWRAGPRDLVLLSCREPDGDGALAEPDEDAPRLLRALAALGLRVVARDWQDAPRVTDWASVRTVLPLACWDCVESDATRERFVAFVRRLRAAGAEPWADLEVRSAERDEVRREARGGARRCRPRRGG